MSHQFLLNLWSNPFFHAAILGMGVAARIDYNAFTQFKSASEAAKYDWKVAGWRWFQGAVVGLVGMKLIS